ncbi:hypothetical protein D3C84_569610 [compost metagenome]
MGSQQRFDEPHGRGDDHGAHQAPERGDVGVIGNQRAGGLGLLLEFGLHGLGGGRHAGRGQQWQKVDVGALAHRVISKGPYS